MANSAEIEQTLNALQVHLKKLGPIAVALSGGVDSMTLAVIAGRTVAGNVRMIHASSAAVPGDASERIKRYAKQENWALKIINAGEFDNADYLANPANRCFFCKTSLYSTMASTTDDLLLSGTNLDDLGDYRPGLQAAADHQVQHPYVNVGIDKATVRKLAHYLDLHDLADLPAAPCLSSRVETGIRIEADVLQAIYKAERLLTDALNPQTVRCRVRHDCIAVELDKPTLTALSDTQRASVSKDIDQLFAELSIERPLLFQAYTMGSAFLRAKN